MKPGDHYEFTREDGSVIEYAIVTIEDLHVHLRAARNAHETIEAFDDPMRRVVGWATGAKGWAVTLTELKNKRGNNPEWFWPLVSTVEGRKQIAQRYSVKH